MLAKSPGGTANTLGRGQPNTEVNIMNLTRFDGENGIELVIDTNTGQSFATVSGYARMSGKHQTTISKRLRRMNDRVSNQAEIQTETGLKVCELIDENLICEWLPKDNPEMATQLMKLGVRMYLHVVAGFKDLKSSQNWSLD